MKPRYNLFKKTLLSISVSLLGIYSLSAQLVAHFPMNVEQGKIKEVQTGNVFNINGNFTPESISGAEGQALRFDGYSSYINAQINASALNGNAFTFSLWCAVESYPMMNNDGAVNTSTYVAGNLNEANKSGFAILLSSQGDYAFEYYAAGWPVKVTVKANDKLPRYEWNHLAAVINMDKDEIVFYRNGWVVGTWDAVATPASTGGNDFIIGKSFDDIKTGPFLMNTFNGLIDDIRLYNVALPASALGYKQPETKADLSIPASRFKDDILRPVFHGMPAAAWTNEPHGLVYYDNKYHLFFQKNANGPYWGKLHWGHISSPDLFDWHEEQMAIAPDQDYDIKGCWSGCVFMDNVLTKGKPYLYYTAVDNGRATIAEAYPLDEQLIGWGKDIRNPIIPHRPDGLSDDFRDPYIFQHNGKYYMIVGTSKDGMGATTLHEYNPVNRTWSNDGRIFFKGTNSAIAGHFWEMPVIHPMGDNKWLFLVTPLSGREGVEVLYWVGNINADGTFAPFTGPKEVELGTIGRDGYGLLSPSVYQKDGKNIAIGIVPDKLPSDNNYDLGWAHTFSLPREWTLDANNNLVQKPYAGLVGMRSPESFSATGLSVSGNHSLTPVIGRSVEVKASWKVGDATKAGFRFFKTGNRSVDLYYDYTANKIIVDVRSTIRLNNDGGSFNGLYEASLPELLDKGANLTIHAFVDHSIMDVFLNDKWAFSVRIFPTDEQATGIEAFSEGGTTVFNSVNAWILDPKKGSGSGINPNDSHSNIKLIASGRNLSYSNVSLGSIISFYDFQGKLLLQERLDSIDGEITSPITGLCIVRISGETINYFEKLNFE